MPITRNAGALYLALNLTKVIDMNTELFLQGQKDCQDGKPHEAGKGVDYDRGYACQYELEQALSHTGVN